MNLRARQLGLPAVVIAVLAVLVWAFVPAATEVELGRVVRGPLQVTVDEEGRTRVRERYVVSAPLAGRLRRIPLDPGDEVRSGETLLATIDPTDPALLDSRAVAEAEARVRAAEAKRSQAGPNLERARAAHTLAAKELERAKRLFESEALSLRELDTAEERARAASEDLKAAEFAAEIAGFELEVARAALLRTRPGRAGAAEGFDVRAPVDGRVLRILEESETVVRSGARLLEVGDPTDLEIEIDVLSSDAVRIPPGAPVILEHWGGERPLAGRVRLVEPGGFMKVSALGVEEQRVNVIVDLVDPADDRPTLGDGYRVDARIVVWQEADVLKAPGGAFFRRGEEWAAFAVKRGRAKLRTIDVGRTNGLETQVIAGLDENDVVVLHPSDRIGDGVAVRGR